jgi:putative endonuclease
MRGGWVYIMTNWSFGTLYVGVTSDLDKRVAQHKAGTFEGFTHRYRVTRLVYVERHDSIVSAIRREKNIKHWPRAWKVDLIIAQNSNWDDLSEGAYSDAPGSSWGSPGQARR